MQQNPKTAVSPALSLPLPSSALAPLSPSLLPSFSLAPLLFFSLLLALLQTFSSSDAKKTMVRNKMLKILIKKVYFTSKQYHTQSYCPKLYSCSAGGIGLRDEVVADLDSLADLDFLADLDSQSWRRRRAWAWPPPPPPLRRRSREDPAAAA